MGSGLIGRLACVCLVVGVEGLPFWIVRTGKERAGMGYLGILGKDNWAQRA